MLFDFCVEKFSRALKLQLFLCQPEEGQVSL